MSALKWTGDPDMRFAHAAYGTWTVEQRSVRGKGSTFHVTLKLRGILSEEQDFGKHKTPAAARKAIERDHKVISKLDM